MNRIPHAIAYCEVYIHNSDPGESNELEMLMAHKGVVPVTSAVSIIKESVTQKPIRGRDVILREMDTVEFREYINHKLAS